MTPNRSSKPRSLHSFVFGSSKPRESSRPPSPTFSDATNVSNVANGPEKVPTYSLKTILFPSLSLYFHQIITRNDLKNSVQAYEDLMTASASYRAALAAMANATFAFADAMQACSLLKGASYEAATRLQVSSGLHHLIGNQWLVLAQSLEKKFEKPLKQHLESYKTIIRDRSASYERALREKSQIIRETESRNLNRKERNLQTFREALAVLQRQVDELDELKATHYTQIMEHEEEVWNVVQGKTCVVVRSELDVFDKFVSKASDPVIEPMLLAVPDPFDSYGPPQSEDHIFSILAPLSITPTTSISAAASTSVSPPNSNAFSDPVPSWLASTEHDYEHHSDETLEGEPSLSPPRSSSPPTPTMPSSSAFKKSHVKRDSKLRSVLSVIDEQQPVLQQHSRQSSHEDATTTKTPELPASPWASDLETATDEIDRTPRNSGVYDRVDDLGEPSHSLERQHSGEVPVAG